MANILYVCWGNVGRSQMAAGWHKKLSSSDTVRSAGTDPTTPPRYDGPVDDAINVMKEVDVDISDGIVKFITEDMVEWADKIYVLCDKTLCPDFLLQSSKITFAEPIVDPFQLSTDTFRHVRDHLKKVVSSFLAV